MEVPKDITNTLQMKVEKNIKINKIQYFAPLERTGAAGAWLNGRLRSFDFKLCVNYSIFTFQNGCGYMKITFANPDARKGTSIVRSRFFLGDP